MPGTNYKVDWVFGSLFGGVSGWTETHYRTGSGTINDTLLNETSNMNLTLRLMLLHRSYALQEVRVSDTEILRDSLIQAYGPAEGVGSYDFSHGSGFAPPMPPWVRLLIRCESGSLVRRSYEIGGIATSVLTPTYAYNSADPTWAANWPNFAAAHLTGGECPWAIRKVTFGTPLTPATYQPIATILPGVTGRELILTFTGPGFGAAPPPGTIIKVSGVTGADHCNHLWTVAQATQTLIRTRPGRHTIFGIPANGAAAIGAITFPILTRMGPLRGSKRNTGRPFGELHGRARLVV